MNSTLPKIGLAYKKKTLHFVHVEEKLKEEGIHRRY